MGLNCLRFNKNLTESLNMYEININFYEIGFEGPGSVVAAFKTHND